MSIPHKYKHKPYVNNLPLIHQGKTRDTFKTKKPGTRLIVTTDRISTHNIVHNSLISGKGQILTATQLFWILEVLTDVPNHILAYGKAIYNYLPGSPNQYPDDLHLRSIIALNLTMDSREYIFRARMAGSLWNDYYRRGLPNPYGLDLPKGLHLMSPFSRLEFTPTEKSETDNPENSAEVEAACPNKVEFVREVYQRGREFGLRRGIDIIDSKAEGGYRDSGRFNLGDEWLTGDCCRFVEADKIVIGQEPPWLDKEFVRQEVVKMWDGGLKVPVTLSTETIETTVGRYRRGFEMLTGRSLEAFQNHALS